MTTSLVVACLLIFFRVAAFVALLPPFTGRAIPNPVKIGLAVCLTALWCGRSAPELALELGPDAGGSWLLLAWLAGRETMFGLGLGYLLGLILVPIRIAGAYIVQEMGLTMGGIASPTEATDSNVLSQLFEAGAVLFLLGANLHHQFLRLFDALLDLFPPGRSWVLPEPDWFIGSIAATSDRGLAIAAPVGVVLFASLVLTLFIMRQAPQFNLFSFGLPARLLVGLGAVLWFLPTIFAGMVRCLEGFASFRGMAS